MSASGIATPRHISRTVQHEGRLLCDKADLSTYYYDTYNRLSQICVPVHFLHCLPGCCDVQQTIVDLFTQISNVLQQSAGVTVPKCKAGFFKPWWTDALSDLKSASIEAHNIWKEAGRPSQGDIHRVMRQAKLAYQNAIRAADVDADLAISNDLHEYLMQKDMISFWTCWQNKFCKHKHSPVIDGSCDGRVIWEKFADNFKSICSTNPSVSASRETTKQFCWYTSQHGQCTLFTIETVDKCLRSMKLGKAASLYGIEIKHLLYAHPLLIGMLCVLFNIMLIKCCP